MKNKLKKVIAKIVVCGVLVGLIGGGFSVIKIVRHVDPPIGMLGHVDPPIGRSLKVAKVDPPIGIHRVDPPIG